MSQPALRARHSNGDLKAPHEMTAAECLDLLNENGPKIVVYARHSSEPNTWVVASAQSTPRMLVTAYCKPARFVPLGQAWRVDGPTVELVRALLDKIKQACKTGEMPIYTLTGMSTSEQIEHLSAISIMGINAKEFQLDEAYKQLSTQAYVDLWQATIAHGLTKAASAFQRQFLAEYRKMSLSKLLEFHAATSNFPAAKVPLTNHIWYKVKTTYLSVQDAINCFTYAPTENFSRVAIEYVADRSWEADHHNSPANLPAGLAQMFQTRFNMHNARYQGRSLGTAVGNASTQAPAQITNTTPATNAAHAVAATSTAPTAGPASATAITAGPTQVTASGTATAAAPAYPLTKDAIKNAKRKAGKARAKAAKTESDGEKTTDDAANNADNASGDSAPSVEQMITMNGEEDVDGENAEAGGKWMYHG